MNPKGPDLLSDSDVKFKLGRFSFLRGATKANLKTSTSVQNDTRRTTKKQLPPQLPYRGAS